jgi:hypothetical protein
VSNIEGFVEEVESSCSQRKAMTLVRVCRLPRKPNCKRRRRRRKVYPELTQ